LKTKIKSDFLYQRINKEFKLFAGIGFGIFLFLLFFQPFALNNFDKRLPEDHSGHLFQ